jgi:hypothetical protein
VNLYEQPPQPRPKKKAVSPCKYAGLNYFDGIYTIREDREQELTDKKQAREDYDLLHERFEALERLKSTKRLQTSTSRSPVRYADQYNPRMVNHHRPRRQDKFNNPKVLTQIVSKYTLDRGNIPFKQLIQTKKNALIE